MRFALLIVSIVLSILLAASPGHAQSRFALVIGNSVYRDAPPLPNTQNDAADVAASFQRLGFSVKTLHDATFDNLRRSDRPQTQQAATKLQGGDNSQPPQSACAVPTRSVEVM
jgi:hypothetical protein